MFENGYEEFQSFDKNFPFKITLSNKPAPMGKHWHNSVELMYFYGTSGCNYNIKNKNFKIQSHDLTIANPFEVHSCEDFCNGDVCCLIFSTAVLDAYNGVIFNNHIKNDEKISAIFEKIKSYSENPYFSFLAMSAVYELIAYLLSDYVYKNESLEKRRRFKPIIKTIDRIILYIKENFRNDISISRIAKFIGLSESRISHIFKEITGLGINEYIELTRLDCAEQMLKETEKSITEIAISCGYNDHCYFSHRFRIKNGISPTDFRKIHTNGVKNA